MGHIGANILTVCFVIDDGWLDNLLVCLNIMRRADHTLSCRCICGRMLFKILLLVAFFLVVQILAFNKKLYMPNPSTSCLLGLLVLKVWVRGS